jgi:tetratricopeptide (TPR) repeat protein
MVDAADHLIRVLFATDAPPNQIIDIAQETLAQHPNHPDIWYQLGKGLAKANAKPQAVQAVERALQCLTLPGANEQVWLRHRVWEAYELLGALNWELAQYQAAYSSYKRAFSGKPELSNGWPAMLNNLCALAIEFKDHNNLPAFFERLFQTEDAPLGMFFFHVNQVASTQGPDRARALLHDAATRYPRLSKDPEYQAVIGKIG